MLYQFNKFLFVKSKIIIIFQKIQNKLIPWIDDIFPPNENSLLGKNDNDEYIDQNEGKYKMIHSSKLFPVYQL